jgi:hypothetical protein
LRYDVELLIVSSIIKLADWGFSLRVCDLQVIIQDYLIKTKIRNNLKDCLPGRKFCYLFMGRWKNEISNRIAENLPKSRAEAMNKVNDANSQKEWRACESCSLWSCGFCLAQDGKLSNDFSCDNCA